MATRQKRQTNNVEYLSVNPTLLIIIINNLPSPFFLFPLYLFPVFSFSFSDTVFVIKKLTSHSQKRKSRGIHGKTISTNQPKLFLCIF